ncbi:MAG TPA: hypothetical protein VF691_08010, partial [Cytophagaceae bacterium]
MRNFLLSSLFLLIVSCHRSNYANNTTYQAIPSLKTFYKLPFTNEGSSYLYKTAANIYGHYLSGLLLIKPFENENFRIVFTNELGVKFFDFEFIKEEFKVHYVIDKLDKKPVLKVLEKDFRLLLAIGISEKLISKIETDTTISLNFVSGKENIYYSFDRKSLDLEKAAILNTKQMNKVTIDFNNCANRIPMGVKIMHHNIKLDIDLHL